jgi:hypothetical protein
MRESTHCSSSGSVLRRASGNQFCIVVLNEVLIEPHMLLRIGENGVVGFQSIFLEKLLVADRPEVSNCFPDV